MTITPHGSSKTVTLHQGDCIEVLRELPDASVDSVVTDPPYGLEFMGREWDGADGFRRSLNPADTGRDNPFGRTSRTSPDNRAGHLFQEWSQAWATECLRVLKPGGHLLAFGGTRTFHRLACAIEDAGFEIRDSIAWLYGSGFPKSLDVSKAIDKAAGAEREVTGVRTYGDGHVQRSNVDKLAPPIGTFARTQDDRLDTAPATPAAQTWQGWGTALKPAFEPVVVARKPLTGTVAANVLTYGTGAINVDACRIEGGERPLIEADYKPTDNSAYEGRMDGSLQGGSRGSTTAGRWPANVTLDEHTAHILDQQSGIQRDGVAVQRDGDGQRIFNQGDGLTRDDEGYGGSGGASRFYYTAKAATEERVRVNGVAHPTVKPLSLMRWLVRLVTPPGGTVLEPFAGSGTTVEACILEGFQCVAIEREADYIPLIMQRINRRLDPVAAVKSAADDDDDLGLFDLLGEDTA